ncbi:MAG: ABC transporter ATP-binding protein [Acholeplasmataceae bacterium]|jgi:putative ABC transport system ATP-binding protein|nr:ABC transporter ATP-binding protein [Acholeplasmataceae bacterium]
MKQIVVQNLMKNYMNGKISTPVLRGLDFSIEKGEFVSLVGPSGSGKTTLLYVLGGLEDYQEGSVLVFDKELKHYTNQEKATLRSKKIGFVFQFYNLIPNLSIYENILLSAVLGNQSSKDDILKILDIVGLKDYENYYPSQLSGGMQQRVAIARCLINEPDIIFADEPTGNLDYENGKKIMELFLELNQVYGKTILMVTHNEETTNYANRIIHLLDGKVIKDEKKLR